MNPEGPSSGRVTGNWTVQCPDPGLGWAAGKRTQIVQGLLLRWGAGGEILRYGNSQREDPHPRAGCRGGRKPTRCTVSRPRALAAAEQSAAGLGDPYCNTLTCQWGQLSLGCFHYPLRLYLGPVQSSGHRCPRASGRSSSVGPVAPASPRLPQSPAPRLGMQGRLLASLVAGAWLAFYIPGPASWLPVRWVARPGAPTKALRALGPAAGWFWSGQSCWH